MPHQKQSGKFQAPLKSSSTDPCEALPMHTGEDNPHFLAGSWLRFAVCCWLSVPWQLLSAGSPWGSGLGKGRAEPHIIPDHLPAPQRAPHPWLLCLENKCFTTALFSEGCTVHPSGCCLALCYKILYFSFLFFSLCCVLFFPLDLLAGMVCGGMVNY